MTVVHRTRRLSAGVELQPGGGAHARVWAPACHTVEILLSHRGGPDTPTPLERERDGYFSGDVAAAVAGDRYWFVLDRDQRRPDPVSRWQPDGPHGASAIVDPSAFAWSDGAWRGPGREGQVLYEMHVGTFTREGTWAAAATRLEHLKRVGITTLQMMPVADFSGAFGWGYDGVNLYAPTRLYGTPDDLRRFVDRAHAVGLAVILDVVYNHLGPDGNYLAEYSRDYFTDRYRNDWGQSLNFEGPARGACLLRRERRLLDRRVSLRRLAPRRDAGRARRLGRALDRGARAPRPRRRAVAAGVHRRRERAAADDARAPAVGRRLRTRRAAQRRLSPLGSGGAHRAPRSVLLRLHRLAAGAALGVEVRLPVSRAVVLVAEAAGAARWRSICLAARSSTSSRITIRSRTPRSGGASIS